MYDDAAGNMLDDGANQYLYNADGHVCAVRDLTYGDMTGYLYNASGQRVAKGSLTSFTCDLTQNGFTLTRQYILGPNGEQMTEIAYSGGTSTPVHTNVVAGGVIATYLPNDSASPHFRFADWLGTTRGGWPRSYINPQNRVPHVSLLRHGFQQRHSLRPSEKYFPRFAQQIRVSSP